MNAPAQQWKAAVAARIAAPLVPFILAIIENESGGRAGAKAYRSTRITKNLPSETGGVIAADRALGLMQTIPLVIDDFNKVHSAGVTYEQMTGATKADGMKQIQVGIWTFLNNVRALERLTNQSLFSGNRLNLNLLKLVLVSYAWGIGNLRNKLDVLADLNLDPTFDNLRATFPELGKPANQPLVYVDRIFRKAAKYEGAIETATTGASIIGALLIGGLLIWAARGSI